MPEIHELTEQEQFWAGEFGDRYISRNIGAEEIANKTALLARILANTGNVKTVIEFGCNVGLNLHALRHLLPGVTLTGVEINQSAAMEARNAGFRIHEQSILDYHAREPFDLVLTSGVLIHMPPDRLTDVYDSLHAACGRYLVVVEYYNPTPVEVPYRGHRDRLFKRDWAGELMDRFHDLQIRDYGFVYHRAPRFPLDDLTWFLLERSPPRTLRVSRDLVENR